MFTRGFFGFFYDSFAVLKSFFFKLFFFIFQWFFVKGRNGFGLLFFSSILSYFGNANVFLSESIAASRFFFQDAKFLQCFIFFHRRPLLQSYRLRALQFVMHPKTFLVKGKRPSKPFVKFTRFFRPKFVFWKRRIRGFFRRRRLKLLWRYRFLHRRKFHLAFPGVRARILHFKRKKARLLYFSLVLGTYKKVFSSVLHRTALSNNLVNLLVNSNALYSMVEFFCNNGGRKRIFWQNKRFNRSEWIYKKLLAKQQEAASAKVVPNKLVNRSSRSVFAKSFGSRRLYLQRDVAIKKRKSFFLLSSKSVAFFLYFFNLSSFVMRYDFLFFRRSLRVVGFYFFSFLRILRKGFWLIKYARRYSQKRYFAFFKLRLLRAFKVYLLYRFFSKWSLVRFIKESNFFRTVAKRRLLAWLFRRSKFSSMEDIKWRFFFRFIKKKRFFKFIFRNRLFLRFVRRSKDLYSLFICIFFSRRFLQIKRFRKICGLSFLRKKFMLKFFFRRSFRQFYSSHSVKPLLRRFRNSRLINFLQKKKSLFGKEQALFKRHGNAGARKTLKVHQKFVYRKYRGRRCRRQRGYMLRCSRRFFSKSLRFTKVSLIQRELRLNRKLSGFFARRVVPRYCFKGFYSFCFFSSFSFVCDSFNSLCFFFRTMPKSQGVFFGRFRLFLCRALLFFFFFMAFNVFIHYCVVFF